MLIPYPNKLKQYRTQRKLSQQAVVNILKHSSTNRLSTWENGIALPSMPNLFKLCALYRVSAEKLYGGLFKKVTRPLYRKHAVAPFQKPRINYEIEASKELLSKKSYKKKTPKELVDELAQMIVEMYLESKGFITPYLE